MGCVVLTNEQAKMHTAGEIPYGAAVAWPWPK